MRVHRILVVDDDPACLRMCCRCLDQNGFSVTSATSGPEALAAVRAQPPALILLDVNLGGMSGIAVYRALRRSSATSSIPVILMTGLVGPDDLLDCARNELGCGPIWRKPGTLSSLLDHIRRALSETTTRSSKS